MEINRYIKIAERKTELAVILGIVLSLGAVYVTASGLTGSSADKLVAEYRFEEGAGQTAYDTAGSNDAGFTNDSTWTTGEKGGALKFNGSNYDYAEGQSVEVPQEGTISGWIKGEASEQVGDNIYPFGLYRVSLLGPSSSGSGRAGLIARKDGSNTYWGWGDQNIYDGKWHHYVVTWNENNVRLYLDGEQIGDPKATNGNMPVGELREPIVGSAWSPDSYGPHTGKIDEVKFYSDNLSLSQIKSLYGEGSYSIGSKKSQSESFKVLDMSFTPKNSSHVFDTSGNQNHGEPRNGASQETAGACKVGRCYIFDGADDYTAISNYHYESETLSNLTVSSWIKADSDGIIASFDRNEYWRFEIGGNAASSGHVGMSFDGDGGQIDNFGSTTQVADGKWHHVAFSFNQGEAKLFVDGREENSINSGSIIGTGGVRYGFIGVGSEAEGFDGSKGPESYFDGEIDEFKIYNDSLSQEEIIDETEGLSSGGAVLDMRFDENGGDKVYDHSGESNHAVFKPNESEGPDRTRGVIGNALEFDGVNDRAGNIPLSGLGRSKMERSGSIAVWVKPEASGDVYNAEPKRPRLIADPSNSQLKWIWFDSTGLPTGDDEVRISEVPSDEWSHITSIWNNQTGEWSIYRNGELVKSGDSFNPSTFGWSGRQFCFGEYCDHDTSYYKGAVDQAKIFPYEISSEKVKSLYGKGKSNLAANTGTDTGTNIRDELILSQTFDRVEKCGQSDTLSCPSGMSGDITIDESNEANHGELVNGPTEKTSAECKSGKCLEFDGSDDYVDAGDKKELDMGKDNLTVSSWIRTTNTPGNYKVIIDKGPSSGVSVKHWMMYQNGERVGYSIGDGNSKVETGAGSINDGEWHHVLFSANRNSNVKLYVDGKEVLSEDMTGVEGDITNNYPVRIGGNNDWGRYFTGQIDQVRVYNQSFSKEEVWKLYTNGRDRSSEGEMAGPSGLWRFDEETSSINTEQKENVNLQADGNGNTVNLGKVSFDDSGWYKVSYGSTWHSETAGGRHYMKNWIRKNGGSTVKPSENRCYIRNTGNGDSCSNSGVILVNANKEDYIELIGTKLSGTNGETVTVDDHYVYAQRIDNPVAQAWDSTGGQNYDGATITLNLTDSTKVDSEFSFSSSSNYLQVNEAGLYKVYYSINNDDTGQGDRQVPHSWIRLNGNSLPSEHPIDSYSYLRNTGSYNHQTGTGLLNLNSNDYLQVRQKKEHQQSSGSSETEPDRSWLLLEKLPTNNVLQIIERAGGQRINNGDTDSITFDTDLIEGDRYTHNSNSSKIFVNETGWYEVSYSFTWDDGDSGGRHILTGWLRENGDEKILPSEQRDYTRGGGRGRKNTITSNTVQKFEKGDYIELRVNARGGYGDVVANGTYITLNPVQGAPDSASDNHGLVKGNPIWKSGKKGNAMDFDGADDYVDISENIVSPDQNLTVSFWTKPDQTSSMRPLSLRGDVAFVTEFENDGTVDVWVDGTWHTGLSDYSAGNWRHWTLVYESSQSKWKLFNNAKKVAEFTDNLGSGSNDNVIGSDWWGGNTERHFDGKIDDVRIYPYAMNENQVQQVMNSGGVSVGS